MKVAATYDNGEIFQHFGRTEQFKVYEIEDGKVVSSEVRGTDGRGHGELVQVLREIGADALICGGLGGGAVQGLTSSGIAVYAGNQGSADEAAERFAEGTLTENCEANCDHHGHEHGHEEGHECHCGHHHGE